MKNLDVVKSIEIPEKVTVTDGIFTYDLENKIFGNNITSVKVPEGYTDIGMGAFAFFSNLTNIKLPESLTEIGNSAFNGCTSLKTINFKGTEAQWNAITKGSNWNRGCPSDMQIICNYQGE